MQIHDAKLGKKDERKSQISSGGRKRLYEIHPCSASSLENLLLIVQFPKKTWPMLKTLNIMQKFNFLHIFSFINVYPWTTLEKGYILM